MPTKRKFSPEKKQKLYNIHVDLEKVFDKVLRELITSALRREMGSEYLVRAVVGLYEKSTSQVRFSGDHSEKFPIKMGAHRIKGRR